MKHSTAATIALVVVFLIAQMTGLLILDSYIDDAATEASGELTFEDLPLSLERPQVEESVSFVWIMTAIIIGTILLLIIIHFKRVGVWKVWYFVAISLCLTFAFAAFVGQYIAFAAGLLFALWKIIRPNVIIHNLTEIFIYGGLAAIFVPIMNLFSVAALLVLISIYDAYAVWQSKHMIKMAQFQSRAQVFAGVSIPYKTKKETKQVIPATHHTAKRVVQRHVARKTAKPQTHHRVQRVKSEVRTAILGGGDIGFPLLFAGVVMKSVGMTKVLVIPLVASGALLLLLIYAQKEKFYPAMPFLSAGCFLGYGLTLLL